MPVLDPKFKILFYKKLPAEALFRPEQGLMFSFIPGLQPSMLCTSNLSYSLFYYRI